MELPYRSKKHPTNDLEKTSDTILTTGEESREDEPFTRRSTKTPKTYSSGDLKGEIEERDTLIKQLKAAYRQPFMG